MNLPIILHPIKLHPIKLSCANHVRPSFAIPTRAIPFCAILLFALACGYPPIGLAPNVAAADELDRSLATVLQAGPQAAGSLAAREARDFLANQPITALPHLFIALDSANSVAANWLRTAIHDIVDREQASPQPKWPVAAMKQYVDDAKHSGRGRRLAFELLQTWDESFRDAFLATRLSDPEFRVDAVALALKRGDDAHAKQDRERAIERYRSAFLNARESDQVLAASRKLAQVGAPVDPIRHLGFVTRWYLLGPFDAPGTTGFDQTFSPETSLTADRENAAGTSGVVDVTATHRGKDDLRLTWKPHATTDALGQVNLIAAIAPVRESVGYAYAELDSPREQPVELRCSADDNLSVWINGRQVLARRQWLNGTRLDRFTAATQLKSGVNRVFVKICQGPQHVNPEVSNNWTFQLRFCDPTGAGVPFDVVRPRADERANEDATKKNDDATKKKDTP